MIITNIFVMLTTYVVVVVVEVVVVEVLVVRVNVEVVRIVVVKGVVGGGGGAGLLSLFGGLGPILGTPPPTGGDGLPQIGAHPLGKEGGEGGEGGSGW